MKKTMVFVDFDGTIFEGDSFRGATFKILPLFWRCTFFFLHSLAALKIISLGFVKCFGSNLLHKYRCETQYELFLANSVKKLYRPLLKEIRNSNHGFVIVSASPQFLIEDIMSHSDYDAYCSVVGSRSECGQWIHMHGEQKKKFLASISVGSDTSVSFYGDTIGDLKVLPIVNTFYLCKYGEIVKVMKGGRGCSV